MSAKQDLIPVDEAVGRILAAFTPLPAETVSLAEAVGRTLAEDVVARVTQPPADVSAMDGYAVRASDVATVPCRLRVIGEAPAGGAYDGIVGPGETVRIFTGGPVPAGADAIVIQEDTVRHGDEVEVRESAPPGRYIRPAGLDFAVGTTGLRAGRCLTPRDIGLAAAMNVPWLSVRRRPRVAILASGDEIVLPGDTIGPNQIVSSNSWSLAAFVAANGGTPMHLGIAPDNEQAVRDLAAAAAGADILVTTGGASVGDHDLVQSALGAAGLELDFWRIAMRPGKPLMFGRLGAVPLLGLPGNPVSSMVCALIFLAPVLARMAGRDVTPPLESGRLGRALGANDRRQDYLRATLERTADGHFIATPFEKQDSSMLSRLAQADCLVVRPPFEAPKEAGDEVLFLRLGSDATII